MSPASGFDADEFDVFGDKASRVVSCVAPCPACGDVCVVGFCCFASSDAETTDHDAPFDTIDPESLQELIDSGSFDEGATCDACGAYLFVNTSLLRLEIDPVYTGLGWIHEGRVPLDFSLRGAWPSRWTLTQDESPVAVDLDVSLVLELLHLVEDPRLPTLLDRCAEHGFNRWHRVGAETWEASYASGRDTVRAAGESFEDSLAVACPTPPALAAIVAAAERRRKERP